MTRSLVLFLAVFQLFETHPQEKSAAEKAVAGQSATIAQENPVTLADRTNAVRNLEESARVSLSNGETQQAARLLNRVGSLYLVLNNPRAALASHLHALTVLRGSRAPDVKVDALNGLAETYLRLEQRPLAAETLRKSQNLSEQSGYTTGQAQALLILSDSQNNNNHAVALSTAQRALKLWQSANNKEGLARTYSQIGICYLAQNLLAEASQNFEQAHELWRLLKNPAEQAGVLIELGFVEYRRGEWQASIDYYTQAQGMLDESAEPEKMGRIASGLAAAFNENGMPENGLIQYQRALDYFRQTKDSDSINYATWSLGRTHYLLADYSHALTYLQTSLSGVDQNSLAAAPALQYIGRVEIALGNYADAVKNLEAASIIYRRAANPKEAAQVRALLGQVYERQGNVPRARVSSDCALPSFPPLDDRVNQAAVYYALGQLELKNKNYDLATDYLRQSIEATENIRRVSTSSDLTTAFSATVHERYEAYIECLMRKDETHPGQGFDVLAFETSELARARSLSELLRAVQTNLTPGIDPQLAAQEKSLRQSLKTKENDKIALLGRDYSRAELDALEREVARLESEYKAVTETIRKRYPSSDEMIRPSAWNLRHIQEEILGDNETVLLEYSLGTDASYVWAVTSNEITSHRLPGQKVINEAAQKLYALVGPPNALSEKELAQASDELSQLVLAPVRDSLNKRRIIVVAEGALNYIPFQLLPTPLSDHDLLISSCEVINTPSASILGQLRTENVSHKPPEYVLAAFGDPVFPSNYSQRKDPRAGGELAVVETNPMEPWRSAWRDVELSGDSFDPSAIQQLFYTKVELANLREVAGPKTFVASGFDASREKLASLDLTKFAIVHFATHGILDPRRPEHSGLFLSMVDRDGHAQNGFVTMQDIYRLHAPVDLVVLSACRTGLGKDVRGEGLIGLTRGFMYAGASSVVASLWKVDDEATAELMKRFYGNLLKRRMLPAAALRAAQNSIREEPQWRSPYYWAAFTLQGEYRQAIRVPATEASQVFRLTLASGILLTLLAGLGILYWRYSKVGSGRELKIIPR